MTSSFPNMTYGENKSQTIKMKVRKVKFVRKMKDKKYNVMISMKENEDDQPHFGRV